MDTHATQHALTTTIHAAARLVGQMNEGHHADRAAVAAGFRRLADGVAGLVPAVLGPRFEENVWDWPEMWLAGEYQAARYQLVQLVRRLKTARDTMADRGELAGEDDLDRHASLALA